MEKSQNVTSSVQMKHNQLIDFVETKNDEDNSSMSNPDVSLVKLFESVTLLFCLLLWSSNVHDLDSNEKT